ncbi:MAG: transcription antitermination factor NusB [Ruminococcaceae bacterium]|nr:transcription antitermination factor NusB [Oscillospiraceae bacterium]
MSRKIARELAVLSVYEYGFNANSAEDILANLFSEDFFQNAPEELSLPEGIAAQQEYITSTVLGVVSRLDELDSYIKKHAIGWSIDRISRIAVAILRTSIYEAKYSDDIPVRVAVNEAVEIAKRYDTPETVSFINGVLGSVLKEVGIE